MPPAVSSPRAWLGPIGSEVPDANDGDIDVVALALEVETPSFETRNVDVRPPGGWHCQQNLAGSRRAREAGGGVHDISERGEFDVVTGADRADGGDTRGDADPARP